MMRRVPMMMMVVMMMKIVCVCVTLTWCDPTTLFTFMGNRPARV